MPTNKPMKNQWIEVDGRLIPATLPQHWNGNDWAITGTDNPLPVANYTKKGNLWLPTSEDNPVPTQVTGSNVEVFFEKLNVELAPKESLRPFDAFLPILSEFVDFKIYIVTADRSQSHEAVRIRVNPTFVNFTAEGFMSGIGYEKTFENNRIHVSDWIEVSSESARVDIYNESEDVTILYDFHFVGRKTR